MAHTAAPLICPTAKKTAAEGLYNDDWMPSSPLAEGAAAIDLETAAPDVWSNKMSG